MRQRNGFFFKARAHAAAHGIGVNEGIVSHQKKLFGYGDGKVAHRFGPFGKIIYINAQDAVHHIVGRNGNMRTLMGHGVLTS